MTKDEMLKKFCGSKNYEEAQRRIADAMMNGDDHVYLPGKGSRNDFDWCATYDTIFRLRNDGFDIDVNWNPADYWSVEW